MGVLRQRPDSSSCGGRLRNGLLSALLGLAALGCSDLLGPFLPDDRVPLVPLPPEYEHWWSVVETCSGLQAELGDVEWWVLPGQETFPDGEEAGRYYSVGHQIGLAASVVRDGFVVRHEMLHAMLSANRIYVDHPKPFFENRCGGILSCSGDCQDEVGTAPAEVTQVPLLQADDVEVGVNILPGIIRRPDLEGECVTIVVGAKNVGEVTASMDLSGALTFGWIVEGWGGGGGGGPIPPNDIVLMPPGAVRYYAFDCPRPFRSFEAGEYVVGGVWEGVKSEGTMLTILP